MPPTTSVTASLTLRHWQRDLPASLVVFLVALPLCMGVAIASGAPVSAGLVTGIIGGLIVGFLSGSPLQVSGPAAGLTVIVASLISTLGIEKLGVCVLAAGAIQLLAGYLRLGQWFRAVSPAVIQGMLAGIGILILASQFHVMVDDKPHHSGIANLVSIPTAIIKSFPLPQLGDAEVRAAETRELRLLGQLHLEQTELVETVHHRLGGVTMPSDETRAVLQALAARQQEVLEHLDSFRAPKASVEFAAARGAVHAALDDLQAGNAENARLSQDEAAGAIAELQRARKNHGWAALIGILTIAALIVWKAFAPAKVKFIPAPLIAVAVATLLAFCVQLPVLYVEVPNRLADEIYFPTLAEFRSLADKSAWFFIAQLAIIASAETLLCAAAVDRMHSGPATDFDRELKGQGVGNMLCGLLCALPMTGVIVRSGANVQGGAQSRLSAILHGLWLLLFVCAFARLLRSIPTAALAGILVYTGYKLVDIEAIRSLARRGKSELAIYIATVAVTVCADLLTGVLVGIVLSVVKLLYVFSWLEIDLEEPAPETNSQTLHLRGAATFLKLPALAQTLERVPPSTELHVNIDHLYYIDAACLDLLESWEQKSTKHGGRLVTDIELLARRQSPRHRETSGLPRWLAAVGMHQHRQRPI